MRDWNGIKIVAVDHGYGNVKTANTVTPTGLVAYDTEPIFSGSILEYDGKFYRVGEGHKPFVADKATDDDNYILTLMAIAKELNINPSTATRQVNRMLACGLVTKSTSAEDERRYEICLTGKGRLLLERMDEHRLAASRRVYEHTTEEELQTVYSCLEKEIEALRKLNEE